MLGGGAPVCLHSPWKALRTGRVLFCFHRPAHEPRFLPAMDCRSWVSSTSPSLLFAPLLLLLHFPEATCLSFSYFLYLTVWLYTTGQERSMILKHPIIIFLIVVGLYLLNGLLHILWISGWWHVWVFVSVSALLHMQSTQVGYSIHLCRTTNQTYQDARDNINRLRVEFLWCVKAT